MKKRRDKVTKKVLNEIVAKLTAALDVHKIVLFGSYAGGVPSKDSDLDLLIVAETRETGISRYAMVSRILEPRSIPLDLIVKTPREIKRRAGYFDPFLRNIMMDGIVLYEKKA